MMSLFPAYNEENADNHSLLENNEKNQELSWLRNTSFPIVKDTDREEEQMKNKDISRNEVLITKKCDKTKDGKYSHKKKKKKSREEKSSRHQYKNTMDTLKHSSPKILESDNFYEDKKQERGNFLVDTLHRPAVPKYSKDSYYFKKYKFMLKKYKKDKKIMRYFIVSTKKDKRTVEFNSDPKTNEEQLTKMTEEFNKRLADNPGDVDIWLDYINFQDKMLEFEKMYRKNPIGGERVTSERKLAILERAIQSNPASERLLAERLELSERLRPVDQLAEECKRALVQDPGNMALWRALVRTTRNNMARCTAPGVLQLLSRAITRVSQLRLHRSAVSVEHDILSLLLESGLFLQQAGLWEQLLMLLQMYLSLSLTASGQFDISVCVQEDKLREQEDSVLASGLPLSVLWSRVEKLRAACHFLPDTTCDADPQRVVFSDDLTGLLQPVMSPRLHLRLVVFALVLLKVPLLPTSHTLLHTLGLLDVQSAFNNVETLMAALYPTGISAYKSSGRYLAGAADLINEPQYVKEQQGQSEYLGLVVRMLQRCAELFPTADAVILHAWTLRLYSLLCRLHSLGVANVPATVVKQAKSHAKQLLKLAQFRENLLLYAEYALIEQDAGDLEKACKVLEMAAAMPASEQDVSRTLVCRRLVECLLIKDDVAEKERAMSVLVSLTEQHSPAAAVSEVAVKRSVAKWQQQTTVLVERSSAQAGQSLTVAEAMTPQLLVEWLACHAHLLTLTHSVWEATALLQHTIDLIPQAPNTLGVLWVEQLYELLADILYTHSIRTRTSFTLLRSTLVKAIRLFPNNLSLLNMLACIETGSGGGGTPLWKLVTFFPSSAPLARLVLVFVVRCRVSTYSAEEGGTSTGGSNYLRNLLCQLTAERVSGQCPLMWRLYLQLVAATDSGTQIKAALYKCLQACPWVKAFYLDGVKFLPEELSEIQDLLIEKELRLHTTPEELEILRD